MMTELTIEQKFAIAQIKQQSATMSREELQQKLIETYREMLMNDAKYKAELVQRWGITKGAQ